MATINRLLKAFVRFDGTGRIIPGSLIRRRKMPKTGRWMEIQPYLCCTTSTSTTSTASQCECDSVLTVGYFGEELDIYGYSHPDSELGGLGSLTPNCENMVNLMYSSSFNALVLTITQTVMCSEIIVEIDGIEYTFIPYDVGDTVIAYISSIASNIFSVIGSTHTICVHNTICTTTTTTTIGGQ